jgi:hypothetical protein
VWLNSEVLCWNNAPWIETTVARTLGFRALA